MVFSIWTQMLDLIGKCLETEHIGFERLDGTCTQKERVSAIENMRNLPEKRVFLVSVYDILTPRFLFNGGLKESDNLRTVTHNHHIPCRAHLSRIPWFSLLLHKLQLT